MAPTRGSTSCADRRADVLLSREVRHADRNALVAALGDLGLAQCSDVEIGRKSYGNLIASKHRLEPPEQLTESGPFPELLVGVNVELAVGRVAVMCVHAPNGSGNGWDKIHVLRALSRAAQQLAGERLVIGGDFNEPRYFPGIIPVRSFAWTDEETWEQREHEGWTRTNARGESETASRASWDDAVRWLPNRDRRYARVLGGPQAGSMEPTHWSRELHLSDGSITCSFRSECTCDRAATCTS